MIDLPDEFRLTAPYMNTFPDKDDPKVLRYIEERNEIISRIQDGKMYVKYVSGDRLGSIARIIPDPKFGNRAMEPSTVRYHGYSYDKGYRLDNTTIFARAVWDKRKNNIEAHIPHRDIILLPNYDGPTIYKMFDHKAAKEAALENPEQLDIDGRLIEKGDHVIYINARYGSAFQLCHGVVKDFKAIVDSRKKEIKTIVEEFGTGVLSEINHPSGMIWIKPERRDA